MARVNYHKLQALVYDILEGAGQRRSKCGVTTNSKHWFTTSFRQVGEVPENGARSVGLPQCSLFNSDSAHRCSVHDLVLCCCAASYLRSSAPSSGGTAYLRYRLSRSNYGTAAARRSRMAAYLCQKTKLLIICQ